VLPVGFPIVTALGGVLGVIGGPIPSVEVGIALSAMLLGFCVASAAQPPLWIAAIIIVVFAIFNGHLHGTELPVAVDAHAYVAGFVIGAGLRHVAGIVFGLSARWEAGKVAVRAGAV